MSDVIEIQLGSSKNVDAVNVDQNINISLSSMQKELLSYNESSVIDVSNLFNSERQESEVYRVYGKIDFISVINGLRKDYTVVNDFFKTPRLGDELNGLTKNLLNCFDIYLCYPSTGNTLITGNNYGNYIRDYVVISKLENIEIYKAGFARNIFSNYLYAFDFNIDFNVEGYQDSFGKPINRFYIYFNYKISNNGNNVPEIITVKTYSGNTYTSYTLQNVYNTGDKITGDLVNYVNTNFEETLVERMEYYVKYAYDSGNLVFKYNPFIEIKVRDFDDQIVTANISGKTESDLTIPYYAIKIDNNGNYIWKELLVNGYIDPITGRGVDYPFVNKRHYIFSNIVLSLKPDLTDDNTSNVFSEINFGPNSNLYIKPASDLNKLGNKCA